ncbi:MAG: hypothetical protein KCHDKBKB_01344 [Elusimicrobia bacterium]|nr:hypothetical protein [Elusimicrobiota bacterium]
MFSGFLTLAFLVLPVQDVSSEVAGPYSFGFNLNFPTPAGDTTGVLKNGFGFGFDIGYRPENSFLGVRLDVSHGTFDLTSAVLDQIQQADDGWASYWGIDLSAVLTPRNAKVVRPYVQFGPGIYYEHAEASRFAGGGGVVCDPWFGCWNYNNTEDVADWSTWRVGWMGGAGLNFEFDYGGALYLQAQYHYIDNTNQDIELVPLALGYRHSF